LSVTEHQRILLVEDDSLLRHAFRLLLEDAGYAIREAGTASEAIANAQAETPDLVLLDLGLPDAPGLDVARTLRRQQATRDTPIIALTGRVGAEEKEECLKAGCTSYLTKPIDPKTLVLRLSEFLED
jgi:two-component system phosphate regulon response regulator PhoB